MRTAGRKRAFALSFVILLAYNILSYADVTMEKIKCIYVKDMEFPPDKFATSHLTTQLKKIYNTAITISNKAPEENEDCIILGQMAIDLGIITKAETEKAAPGGFVLKCKGKQIAIAGPDPWSSCYGAAEFLERLGVKMLTKQKNTYPEKPLDTFSEITVIDKPFSIYRSGLAFMGRPTTFAFANCRKAADEEYIKANKLKSDLWIDHSAGYLIPKFLYYDKHPEYFSLLKSGKRVSKDDFTDHRTPLCVSNPDVQRISAERVMKWIEMQPEAVFFPVTYGDTGLWCTCDACEKLDEEPGHHAGRILTWVNKIAEKVYEKYPDKTIITAAYGGSDKVPEKIKPYKNVCILASTGLGNLPFYDHSKKNKTGYKENWNKLDAWIKASSMKLLVCEYMGSFIPAPIEQTESLYKDYAQRGVGGIMFTYGHPSNFINLWYYLHYKLLWNPHQDAKELSKDFIKRYYGKAAPNILKYFEFVNSQYWKTIDDEMDGVYPKEFYSSDFIKNALSCFKTAEEAAKDDAVLCAELKKEESLFIDDALRHSPVREDGKPDEPQLKAFLDRIFELEAPEDQKALIKYARDTYALGVALDSRAKGSLAFVRKYLEAKNIEGNAPAISDKSIIFSAETFMEGYGPIMLSGTEWPCPPRMAVIMYITPNSINRPYRSFCKFKLETVPDDKNAVMEVWGQDSDHKTEAAEMLIKLNGKEIYKGQVSFVKHNWSQMKMKVPAGILKKGENILEIENCGSPESVKKWFERWFAINQVAIKFN